LQAKEVAARDPQIVMRIAAIHSLLFLLLFRDCFIQVQDEAGYSRVGS
jgi:hypothetical protein